MPEPTHILVVEDDTETRELLSAYLSGNGFAVSTAANGREMWERLASMEYGPALIILDVMLPGESGLVLCRKLLLDERSAAIPVIMLTACSDVTDRVVGLELGADDYLVKPYNPRELLARIRSVLRRAGSEGARMVRDRPPAGYRFAGWVLNLAAQRLLAPDGVEVPLTRGEFVLLQLFLAHPDRILDRDQIMEHCHGREQGVDERSVDALVGRLRKRLRDDPRDPRLIKTVWGKGYLLHAPVEEQ